MLKSIICTLVPEKDLKEPSDFGKAVRTRRLQLGLSQAQVAERTNGRLVQSDVSKLENGTTGEPGISNAYAVARALETSIEDLVTRNLNAETMQPGRNAAGIAIPDPIRLAMLAMEDRILAEMRELLKSKLRKRSRPDADQSGTEQPPKQAAR